VSGVGKNPKSGSGLKREDLFITSKLFPNDMLKPEDVKRSVTDSLSKLKTEYIDLYLMHWPAPGATLETMEVGMGDKNPHYRRVTWDALTELFKCDLLINCSFID
jgi:diketogulonate reductase-like aldo/keto reductase